MKPQNRSLTETDKNHFYGFHGQDPLTVVVICLVTITHKITDKKSYRTMHAYIAKTDHNGCQRYTELVTIREKIMASTRNLSTINAVDIQIMSTKGLCGEFLVEICKMLHNFKQASIPVVFKLRIAGLYKIEGKPDEKVIAELALWKHELQEAGATITLEPIRVCEELPNHQIRGIQCEACKRVQQDNKKILEECSDCKKLSDQKIRCVSCQKLLKQYKLQIELCRDCKKITKNCLESRRKKDENITAQVKQINSEVELLHITKQLSCL